VLENIEFEDEEAYCARYIAKLAQWDDFSPIERDRRLWTAEAV
jgi:hypothetical protein